MDLVADGADERRLPKRDRLGEPFAAGERPCPVHERSRRGVVADPRSAERPPGAGGHVDAHLQSRRLAQRVVQHRHPLRRQVLDEAIFSAAHAVDRRHLDAADPGRRQRLELGRQRARSTALPCHHHRVHGFVSAVIAGQSRSPRCAAGESIQAAAAIRRSSVEPVRQPIVRGLIIAAGIVRRDRRALQLASRAMSETWARATAPSELNARGLWLGRNWSAGPAHV